MPRVALHVEISAGVGQIKSSRAEDGKTGTETRRRRVGAGTQPIYLWIRQCVRKCSCTRSDEPPSQNLSKCGLRQIGNDSQRIEQKHQIIVIGGHIKATVRR